MKKHTNKNLRRGLALFMTVLMALSCFSAGLTVLAAIEGIPTRDNAAAQNWYDDSTLYGAEKWDKTTGAATLTFNWNAYTSSLGYDPQPGTMVYTYPSHIYLNVGETLEAAGYMGHMTASYGENEGDATDFRVMLSSATWGESTRTGFSPISSLISNYGHQGTVTDGTKLMSGSSSHYDFSNDGRGSDQIIGDKSGDNENFLSANESVVVWRSNIKLTSPGLTNFDEYVLLTGTANKTGEVTFNPTSTQNFTIGAAQRYTAFAWHSDNGTRFNRFLMNGGSRPQVAPAEDALSITFTVYDKSELNRLIEAADAGTLTADPDALAAARAVLADREVTQAQIDAAAESIGDRMTMLVNGNVNDYTAGGNAFGTEANTFNAQAFHQGDPAASRNVVYSPTGTTSWWGWEGNNYYAVGRLGIKFATPENVVMVYDGVSGHEPYAPIEIETFAVETGGSAYRAVYAYKNDKSIYNLGNNLWAGSITNNANASNSTYVANAWDYWAGNYSTVDDFDAQGNNGNTSSDSLRDNSAGRFWWNTMAYQGTGNYTSYYDVETDPTFNVRTRYGSTNKDGTVMAKTSYYTINYKPVYDKLVDAAAVKAIIDNADEVWKYTDASVKRVKATLAVMEKANPKSYGYSNVAGDVQTCANYISDAVYMFDHQGLVLEKKQGTVTFVDQLGNTIAANGTTYTYTREYGETVSGLEIPVLGATYNRTDNAQWDYSAYPDLSWSPAIAGNAILVNEPEQIFQINDSQTVQKYTVTFYDEDGTTALKSEDWQYGDYPVWGSDVAPTKAASAQKTYKFDHWVDTAGNEYALNGELKAFVVDTLEGSTRADLDTDAMKKYTAVFVEDQDVLYTLNFYNGDSSQPYVTQTYLYGDTFVAPEEPTFSDNTDVDFRFVGWAAAPYPEAGWDQAVTIPETVTASADYYSLYDGYVTVTWMNGSEQIGDTEALMVGDVPVFTGATPTTSDAQYTYTSIGWATTDNATEALAELPEAVESNLVFYAVYDKNNDDYREVNTYPVTITAGANTTLSVTANGQPVASGDEVAYGTELTIAAAPTAAYSQSTAAVKINGEAYADVTYTVTGDTSIATDPIDDSQINTYTVTWKVDNDAVETDPDVTYGATPSFDGETPTKTDPTGAVTYTFIGWDGDINAAVYADTVFNAVFSETPNFGPDDIEDAIAEKLTGILNDEGDLPYGECYTEATLNAFYAAYLAVMDFEGEPKTDENVNALAAALDDLLAAAQALVVEHDWQDNWVGGRTHPHYDPEELSTVNPAVNNKVCATNSDHTETVEIYGATHYTTGDPNYKDLYAEFKGLVALCTNVEITDTVEQALSEATVAFAQIGLNYTNSEADEAALVEELNAAKLKIDALQALVDADKDGMLDDGALVHYTITWNLANGTAETTSVASGTTPSHADDTKEATTWYTFTFTGWTPALAAATEDKAYTSTFNRTATQTLTDLIGEAQDIVNNAEDYDAEYQDEIGQIDGLLDKYPDTITEEEIETLDGLVEGAEAYALYTITFVTEGSPVGSITAKNGTEVSLPDSAKDGFHFEGWYTDSEFAAESKVTSPYTLTASITLYAFFEALSLDAAAVEAAITAATAGVTMEPCYTAASYQIYTDALAAVRAFKNQPATTANLTAYEAALTALDNAVTGLVEAHDYTGEATLTRPVYNEETETWSQGVYTTPCANGPTTHPARTEYVDRANYTKYESVLSQIISLLGEDLTDDVKAALQTAKTAMEAIEQAYVVPEQSILDGLIQEILNTLNANDKITVDEDGVITVDPDTAYNTYTLRITNNVNTDYMEFTKKAGTTAHLNPILSGYTLKGFSANENYNAETGIYTFPQANDTITALYVKDLTGNQTIAAAQAIITDANDPDTGSDYDGDYIDDLEDLLDELDEIKNDPTKLDDVEQLLEDIQELVDAADSNKLYTITWVIDGASETTKVKVGETPTHAAPTKEGFHFTGWDPAIVAVTGDATYTAQFEENVTGAADYEEYDELFAILVVLKDNDAILPDLLEQINDKVDNPLPRDLTADQQDIIDAEVEAIKALLDRIVEKDGNGDYTTSVKESALVHCSVTFYWLSTKLTKTVIKGDPVAAPNVTAMYGVEGMESGHYVFDKWTIKGSDSTDFDLESIAGDLELEGHYKLEDHTGSWVEHPATCSSVSWHEIDCTTCGMHFKANTGTEKAPHDWNDWVVVEATCAHPGSRTRTCQNDPSHKETEIIPQLSHTDANNDTICDVCGNPTENHQHTDNNGDGKCDTCGAKTNVHAHTDGNNDGVCDGCGSNMDGSFRCNLCSFWEQYKGVPVFGWFVIIIHYIYHLIAQITSWR